MGHKGYFMKFLSFFYFLLVCFQVSFAEDLCSTCSDDSFLHEQDEMVFIINQNNTAELAKYVGSSKVYLFQIMLKATLLPQ